MDARKLLLGLLVFFGAVGLPAPAAYALQVKVSVNFGPTITGPDNGTLIVTANPGDLLRITWALGTDTDIQVYRGLVSGVDITEISAATSARRSSSQARASIQAAIPTLPVLASSSMTRGRMGLPSVSPGMVVSCGGSNTS